MLNGIFDTHAHYDEQLFDAEREQLLKAQQQNGVSLIINSGFHIPSSIRSIALAEQYAMVYAIIGVYPIESGNVDVTYIQQLEALLKTSRKIVGIGEIGLDYYQGEPRPARQTQRAVFAAQLQLAKKHGLPVEIHDREADEDCLELLRQYPVPGVIHRFNSAAQYGREFLALGMHLGIGPALTYPAATNIQEIVKEMPLERLLLETDAPFLLPAAILEGNATSDMLTHVAAAIADIRGDITPQEVVDISRENGKRLFSID